MAIRKIDLMYKWFGKCEGHACRECSNLVHVRVGERPLSKCKVYGDTPSEASDWTQRYQACGMFDKPWTKEPIIQRIRTVKTKQKETHPNLLDGQIKLEV